MEDKTQALQSMIPKAIGLAMALPRLMKLLYALFADARVPKYLKILTAGAIAYVALPFDFLPDFVPTAGAMDDLLVVMLLLMQYVKSCPRDVFVEHWNNTMGENFDLEAETSGAIRELEPLVGNRFASMRDMITGASAKIASVVPGKTSDPA